MSVIQIQYFHHYDLKVRMLQEIEQILDGSMELMLQETEKKMMMEIIMKILEMITLED